MAHQCDRENCKPAFVDGPKMKCYTCGRMCFLGCYGLEAGTKVDGMDTVKWLSSNGGVFSTYLPFLIFSCCDTVMPADVQRKQLKIPSTVRSGSKGRPTNDQVMINELKTIKEMLTSIQSATSMNTADIAEIKSLSTKTDANMQKVTDSNAATASPALSYHQNFLKRTRDTASGTPIGKRSRSNTPSRPSPRPKPNVPESKVGTKPNSSGLSVVPKIVRVRVRDDKPKFEKALFVSRLLPATTVDGIVDFVVKNTPINVKERMNVHKLVKKGVDEATLDFVSFKIEVSAEDLDILNDSNVWPEGVLVREFVISPPKNVLGRHLPSMNVNEGLPMEVS